MDDINHKILSLGWSFEPHLKGTIIGQTAFNIYRNICNGQDQPLNMDEIHMKLLTIEDYNDIRNGCLNHSSSLKKISNCKLELRWSISTKEMKYFLYEPSYGQIDHYTSLPSLRSRLSFSQSLYVENILDVEINVLLEPLLSLRDCKSINEALMNWSLNKIFFYEEGYIDHESLNKLNMVEFDLENLKEKIGWFLTNKNIQDFVPKKFINRVKKILKAKGSKLFKFAEFLEKYWIESEVFDEFGSTSRGETKYNAVFNNEKWPRGHFFVSVEHNGYSEYSGQNLARLRL